MRKWWLLVGVCLLSGTIALQAQGPFSAQIQSALRTYGFTAGPGSMVTADDGFLGLGAAAGRIEFDDQATDEVNILDALVGIGTSTPTTDLAFGGNAAREMALERHTTADTAGNSFTITSGGATVGATDKAAGDLVLSTGIGTGNALPAQVRIVGNAYAAASGTSDRTQINKKIFNATTLLVDAVATTVATATLAADSGTGGILKYTIEATDGTDFQAESGFVMFDGVNKAGVFTVMITEAFSQQTLSAGSLTTTWAISSADPALISVDANTSLTPTSFTIRYSIENHGSQNITAP